MSVAERQRARSGAVAASRPREGHLAAALVVATVIASPVLLAAVTGRKEVPAALGLYLVAIAGAWLVTGLLGGALALMGQRGPSAPARVAPEPESATAPPEVADRDEAASSPPEGSAEALAVHR